MGAFGRADAFSGGRRGSAGAFGWSGCRRAACRNLARVDDAPDPAVRIVRDVERAVASDGESCRAMRGAARLLHGAGKAVGEDLVLPRGLAAGERLEHHVVAALREWRSIPRAVECDESTSAVALRELAAVVEREVIRGPVAGEDRDRVSLLRTDPDGLSAIAPVLGRQHQLLLRVVEVAFGPPIVGATLEPHELLRRKIRPLLGLVECRPVLRELVPAVLGRIDADARRVDGDAA